MSKTAPFLKNPANQSTFASIPESSILRMLFASIKSEDWAEHNFTFRFVARKNPIGRGFEAHGFSIQAVTKKELPKKYKSPTELALKKREQEFQERSKRAKLAGAKGGSADRRRRHEEDEL